MSIESLMKDRIRVLGPGGMMRGQTNAYVGADGKVIAISQDWTIEDGDLIERELPGGKIERRDVIDAHYQARVGGIAAHWTLQTSRQGSRIKGDAGSQSTGTYVITNSTNVQIGNGNSQSILYGLNSLIDSIEASNLPETEKHEAKTLLSRALAHPVVSAVASAATTAILSRLNQ